MSKAFRSQLQTELGRFIYDWSPMRKDYVDIEMFEEIARSYCQRENFKFIELSDWGSNVIVCTIAGEESMSTYQSFSISFPQHGFTPPILVVENDLNGL